MAYFKLEKKVGLDGYPFDFHSHFSGILPVESDVLWGSGGDYIFNAVNKKAGDHKNETTETVKYHLSRGQPLSLIGLIILSESKNHRWPETVGDDKIIDAHYKLFVMALETMMEENPFKGKNHQSVNVEYWRGECAAENIYIACVIIMNMMGEGARGFDISNDKIYKEVMEILEKRMMDEEIYPIIKYFNKKIYTANEYTPFDDAYWARGIIRDRFNDIFANLTVAYLYREGILYTQTATGKKDINYLNGLFSRFSGEKEGEGEYVYKPEHKPEYKLLAHTANIYGKVDAFKKDLDGIKELFVKNETPHLVGIDLLGAETKNGFYIEFFEFLDKNWNTFDKYRKLNKIKKIILHIHCGEGTGISADNRSLCGYFYKNLAPDVASEKHEAFFDKFSRYIYKCYINSFREAEEEIKRGKDSKEFDFDKDGKLSRLFEELFYNNNLTFQGLHLRRFDITSQTTQSLVAYYARNNIMNLSHALSQKLASGGDYDYYTRLFCGRDPVFSLRIGHGYYYRNYIAEKYQAHVFDTNLGSNFITGASGLFNSAQEYRLNGGFRHLNGYIGTNILIEARNAISYIGNDRLKSDQESYANKLCAAQDFPGVNGKDPYEKGFIDHIFCRRPCEGQPFEEFSKAIGSALYKYFRAQVEAYDAINSGITEGSKEERAARRLEFFHILFSHVLNWRSYILGADGQGVEHSNVQAEATRMVLVLNYGIPSKNDLINERSLKNINNLLIDISKIYWEDTISTIHSFVKQENKREIIGLEGFDSPDSVVLIKTKNNV